MAVIISFYEIFVILERQIKKYYVLRRSSRDKYGYICGHLGENPGAPEMSEVAQGPDHQRLKN